MIQTQARRNKSLRVKIRSRPDRELSLSLVTIANKQALSSKRKKIKVLGRSHKRKMRIVMMIREIMLPSIRREQGQDHKVSMCSRSRDLEPTAKIILLKSLQLWKK